MSSVSRSASRTSKFLGGALSSIGSSALRYAANRSAGSLKRKVVEILSSNRSGGRSTPTALKRAKQISLTRVNHKKMKPCRVPVKVTKKFKSKVLQAMESNAAIGKYTVAVAGAFYPVVNAGLQIALQDLYQGITALQTQAAGNATLLQQLNFFSPDRVLDAASILFNGKVSDVNYLATTGNLTKANLVLEVPYQSVKVTLHNNTQIPKEIEWYECIAKSDTDYSALDQWIHLLATLATGQNLGSISVTQMFASPGQLSSFGAKWSYSTRKYTLAPGRSKSFTMTQKHQCYNWSKMLIANDYPNLPKGFGVSCFYIVRNPVVEIGVSTNANYAGHPGAAVSTGYGVTCETICKYVIEAPEISDDSQKFNKFYMNTYDNVAGTAPYSVLSLQQTDSTQAKVMIPQPSVAINPKI